MSKEPDKDHDVVSKRILKFYVTIHGAGAKTLPDNARRVIQQ